MELATTPCPCVKVLVVINTVLSLPQYSVQERSLGFQKDIFNGTDKA